jgi:ribosomal protein L3 glutamine methyltransferase
MATSAHDEALYLLLRTLGLPLDSPASVLARALTAAERKKVLAVLRRRLVDRVPAAYLTQEAWLGEHRFYVDERVLIPRSYFLELIPQLDDIGAGQAADVCTGSGCLAILLARRFPRAEVDAVDLSADALDVARINVRAHRLTRRVRLRRSDVFDAVPPVAYDIILSNPPYEPSALMKGLPAEFKREPRLALDGGQDGLDVIRKLLRQAKERLKPAGRLLIEVGGLQAAFDREFKSLRARWLRTADGSNCVCEIRAGRL